MIDLAADNTPIIGNIKSGIEVSTGTNLVTGEVIPDWVKGVTTAGIIFPWAKNAKHLKHLSGATKSGRTAISAQKQAGHIPGTPQNANRLKQGKPTSSLFGGKSGNHLTQQAFEKGKPVPGRPNVREHDFGVSTGTGPNGGMQSRVRVHQDTKGRIHGHPSGPERF